MIRATWDTNTLASAAIARHGVIAELVSRWHYGDFEVVVSEHILSELERTLRKPYFATRLTETRRSRFFALVQRVATIVKIVGLTSGRKCS